MRPLSSRRRRVRDVLALVVLIVAVALALVPGWGAAAEVSFGLCAVVSAAWLGYLAWALVTGRVGLSHWAPTARRQARLRRRAAQGDAQAQQQRLAAALASGPYRPRAGPPPGSGPDAPARRALLDAVEQHGGLSPEARAAAEQARREPR